MNVKYIPSDWDKMKDGIGDLIGLGRWGKGMIDTLKDLSDNLEDAESDIANHDSDGVISFHYTSQKGQYQGLYEDFEILHSFTGKVGDIVDRTIDQPFYEDMDAFVEAMRDLSISNYTTTNRLGATETQYVYAGYGPAQSFEVPKTEVSLDDLFSGDNYYASQMKLEYDAWKELNPDQEFSQEEYQQAILNTRAFEYESIRNQQEDKEFWVQIGALVVIVGATIICPPAGLALGAAYGAMELSTAVSGKDWVSGRELGTGERWFRGLLAPLDIVPGVSGLTKFSSTVRLAHLGENIGGIGLRTGVKQSFSQGINHIDNMVRTAGQQSVTRLKSASAVIKDGTNVVKNKLTKDTVEVGRVVESAIRQAKNITPSRRMGLAMENLDDTGKVRMPVENTHAVENKLKDVLSKIDGVNLGGSTIPVFKNVGEYFNYINDIGKKADLSLETRIERIKEAYAALGNKTDINCPVDSKFITGFDESGRVLYDWPDKMGFDHDSITSITRENPLPNMWDRYGAMGGDNFASLPNNGVKYTYDQRAIPYVENPQAYHYGTFDNERYFDVIDALKNNDFNRMNEIYRNAGFGEMDVDDFEYFKTVYDNYLEKVKVQIGDVDATYGLIGKAAPWQSNGEILMQGGAEQIIAPFNGMILEKLGIINKIQ
ncbi:hypothetical protein HFZ78_05220 [Priestia megaterium]|uniref:DUF4237 domain-containing protein n=1 Tax=Priestia megaterium TaxID=1404 RepID=A0A6H1NY27_PRIMG|nr:hypothetical protein [Priestia megaterium]QIZ06199.1 hypothetical protein HFZ78_05220 [Priestia megaterium]